ncbi:NAD(+) diphosphatase [Sphingomonas desiccabilis]|uniref:NAD(+) diphosphatase n=1 Tax=Sphingomonas desiccabilis TaxID=429134 RepID=A0A4Q2IM95_9SPHN|nr:NAD(+) diphosphatase [Sphingomonas desiccabilis]MBB3912212.1 NAD+ diphosphatase [Sphingomonas desiccabilis]RXZ30369.1 NAD(+) diphosphatase [Sphingomonas desiccabilis]
MIGFTGGTLDRADRERDDPEALAAALADPRARLLRLRALEPEVDAHGRIVWDALDTLPAEVAPLFLGYDAGVPRFVAALDAEGSPVSRSPGLMEALAAMPAADAATYAAARSLADWHRRHRFCANCGTGTEPFRAGWARRCPACAAQHFPRTDPVVIMLAEYDGRVLLGRQASWAPGRYSALAGFVEVGESLEEAVRREVLEEAGVPVGAVRYVASQPWPFPSQLMLACIGEALDDRIRLDTDELEDAFWATRDEVAAALARAEGARFDAPPDYAIAYSLLAHWLDTQA